MTTRNTNERIELIRQKVLQGKFFSWDYTPDVTFLISQINSQAVGEAAEIAARQEVRKAAFREMMLAIQCLPMQGTMNYRRGYEEGVRDALRTLEAAANFNNDEGEGIEGE